jgi:hypothetical protein
MVTITIEANDETVALDLLQELNMMIMFGVIRVTKINKDGVDL